MGAVCRLTAEYRPWEGRLRGAWALLLWTVKMAEDETSLVVQWLRILPAMQGTWVQFLVRELRSHTPQSN